MIIKTMAWSQWKYTNIFLCVCVCVCACMLCYLDVSNFCNPMNSRPPVSSAHGTSQARILNGLPFPPPGDLPDPGIEPVSPALAGRFFYC